MGGLATAISTALATKVGTTTVGAILTKTAIIGGTALNVAGTLQAGQEQKRVAGIEATLGEAQAAQEEARTADEELRRRRAAVKLAGTQRARFAAQGIDISTGTPLLVVAETLLNTQEDVEAIRETGRARAKTFRSRAQTFRDFGRTAVRTSRIQAGSSLLTGLSQL